MGEISSIDSVIKSEIPIYYTFVQTSIIIGSSLIYKIFIHTALHSKFPKMHPYVRQFKYLPRVNCKLVFLNQEQLRVS